MANFFSAMSIHQRGQVKPKGKKKETKNKGRDCRHDHVDRTSLSWKNPIGLIAAVLYLLDLSPYFLKGPWERIGKTNERDSLPIDFIFRHFRQYIGCCYTRLLGLSEAAAWWNEGLCLMDRPRRSYSELLMNRLGLKMNNQIYRAARF
jgi:hypothetical protein